MENTGLNPYKELYDPDDSGNIDEVDCYPKPTWMINESVFDTTWELSKTGYDIENFKKNNSRKLSFSKETSSNELLTDKINRPLLDDLRNSLLYLNTKGKISRPERAADILSTACHLIKHANELQELNKNKPIRSLAEISFNHLKSYLQAFKVERKVFESSLDFILKNYDYKNKIDWNSLKQLQKLTTRQLYSLKDKLTKHLDLEKRDLKLENRYIKLYPNACSIEFDIDQDLEPKAKTVSNEISKLHMLFVARPSQKYKFRHASQNLFSSGNNLFEEMVESNKTALIPVNIALHSISSALHFARSYGPALREYISALSETENELINSHCVKKHYNYLNKYQSIAYKKTPIPKSLKNLKIRAWRDGINININNLNNGISIQLAVKLYIASIWILIASVSSARSKSLLTLKRDCFKQSPIDGLFDLVLRIPKTSERWELEDVNRPIPDIIYDYGLEFAAFVCEIENRRNFVNDDGDAFLFSRILNTRSISAFTYNQDVSHLNWSLSDDFVNICLDIFLDWIESPLINGKRWYVRTHQFRRFFAVLYFNFTDGEGLDELSWFMGHANLDQTFHYAEVAPTDEWIEEAEITIAKIGASLNKEINADDDIKEIIYEARKTSKISIIIEPLVKKLISEHKEKYQKEVRFLRIDGEGIFFYFTKK
ncbi:hypothetical protein [Marinomonas lutimaris]|uniref:hypothetical protein n=1 Tax=Marinomonas lutimaris TaxID=2846746 RepID=UPI001CA4CE62|nr:hypothetical protein [Marinomonas lutimaris]